MIVGGVGRVGGVRLLSDSSSDSSSVESLSYPVVSEGMAGWSIDSVSLLLSYSVSMT